MFSVQVRSVEHLQWRSLGPKTSIHSAVTLAKLTREVSPTETVRLVPSAAVGARLNITA